MRRRLYIHAHSVRAVGDDDPFMALLRFFQCQLGRMGYLGPRRGLDCWLWCAGSDQRWREREWMSAFTVGRILVGRVRGFYNDGRSSSRKISFQRGFCALRKAWTQRVAMPVFVVRGERDDKHECNAEKPRRVFQSHDTPALPPLREDQ